MFLLGLKNENIEWQNVNEQLLSEHLYRVQKLTAEAYVFRLAKVTTIENKTEYIQFKYSTWQKYNPIKVKITAIGKINLA